jgi:hypothetical protein
LIHLEIYQKKKIMEFASLIPNMDKDVAISIINQFPAYEYWVAFNDYAFQNNAFAKQFNKRKASTDHWMTMSVGSSACHISINQIRKDNQIVVEWYISDDKELFHKFYSHKSEIETDMDMKLDWRELPDKKASRILISHPADFDNKYKWSEQFDWAMDVAVKMKKAFKKYL